jgi:hypothetical protein
VGKNETGRRRGSFRRARGCLEGIASSRSVLREARQVPTPWIFQRLKAGNTLTAHEDARPPGHVREDTWEGSRPRDPFFAKPGRFQHPGSSNA